MSRTAPTDLRQSGGKKPPRNDDRRSWGNGEILTLLSPQDAAELVGMTVSTIHKASIPGGSLKPFAITPAARRMFLGGEVQRWATERGGRFRKGQRGEPEAAGVWTNEDLLQLLGPQDAADLVGLTVSTIHKASNPGGSLPPYAITKHGRRLFKGEDVTAWMEERGGRYRTGQRQRQRAEG